MNLRNIKDISEKYTSEEIHKCIDNYLKTGEQKFLIDSDDIIGDLSKAEFIRNLMEEESMTQVEAIRELANKMRFFN